MQVIDLFCGAGGFSKGFELAGFENVLGLQTYLPEYLPRFKLKASDFGCETGRRRLFIGNIPKPRLQLTDVNPNPKRVLIAIDNRNKNKPLPPVLDLDEMKFEGTTKEMRQLQANCVPPLVAKAIAKSILENEGRCYKITEQRLEQETLPL